MLYYNPSFYAEDPEWIEWVAAEYEARQAHDDVELALTHWQFTHDDLTFAAVQRYASLATELASKIEDDTDVRIMEAEQAKAEF